MKSPNSMDLLGPWRSSPLTITSLKCSAASATWHTSTSMLDERIKSCFGIGGSHRNKNCNMNGTRKRTMLRNLDNLHQIPKSLFHKNYSIMLKFTRFMMERRLNRSKSNLVPLENG